MTPQHQATSPTPGVPRWTVDDEGDPCWDHDTGQCLSRFDLTGAWNTSVGVPAAHRALVQCVRDADTLRKARQLADELAGVESWDANPGHVHALLDTLRKARQLAARHADSHLDLDVGSPLADLVDLLTEGNPDDH